MKNKTHNSRIDQLMINAVKQAGYSYPNIALKKMKDNKFSFRMIRSLFKQAYKKDLGLFIVGEQVPVNVEDLKQILSLTDGIPSNSDQNVARFNVSKILNESTCT